MTNLGGERTQVIPLYIQETEFVQVLEAFRKLEEFVFTESQVFEVAEGKDGRKSGEIVASKIQIFHVCESDERGGNGSDIIGLEKDLLEVG